MPGVDDDRLFPVGVDRLDPGRLERHLMHVEGRHREVHVRHRNVQVLARQGRFGRHERTLHRRRADGPRAEPGRRRPGFGRRRARRAGPELGGSGDVGEDGGQGGEGDVDLDRRGERVAGAVGVSRVLDGEGERGLGERRGRRGQGVAGRGDRQDDACVDRRDRRGQGVGGVGDGQVVGLGEGWRGRRQGVAGVGDNQRLLGGAVGVEERELLGLGGGRRHRVAAQGDVDHVAVVDDLERAVLALGGGDRPVAVRAALDRVGLVERGVADHHRPVGGGAGGVLAVGAVVVGEHVGVAVDEDEPGRPAVGFDQVGQPGPVDRVGVPAVVLGVDDPRFFDEHDDQRFRGSLDHALHPGALHRAHHLGAGSFRVAVREQVEHDPADPSVGEVVVQLVGRQRVVGEDLPVRLLGGDDPVGGLVAVVGGDVVIRDTPHRLGVGDQRFAFGVVESGEHLGADLGDDRIVRVRIPVVAHEEHEPRVLRRHPHQQALLLTPIAGSMQDPATTVYE